MSTTLKWLFGKPGKKWRVATGLFFVSWSWMTLIPFFMITSIEDRLDRIQYGLSGSIWWIYLIAWGIGSSCVFAMFTHTTRLSEKIAHLEQMLKNQGAEIPQPRPPISN